MEYQEKSMSDSMMSERQVPQKEPERADDTPSNPKDYERNIAPPGEVEKPANAA